MMNPSLFGFFTVVCLILGLLGTGVYTTYFLLEYHIITFYPYFILDIFKRTRISQLYVDSPFSISISWYYPSYLCDGANIFTISYHIDLLIHVFYFSLISFYSFFLIPRNWSLASVLLFSLDSDSSSFFNGLESICSVISLIMFIQPTQLFIPLSSLYYFNSLYFSKYISSYFSPNTSHYMYCYSFCFSNIYSK